MTILVIMNGATLFLFLLSCCQCFGLHSDEIIRDLGLALENPKGVRHLELAAISRPSEKKLLRTLDFSCFTNLETLELSLSGLKKLPTGVGNLKKLKSIDLSDNKFKSVPLELLNIESLREINLNYNRISSFPHEVSALKELHVLNLYGNQIRHLAIPSEANNSFSIVELGCTGNPVVRISEGFFKVFPNLRSLGLGRFKNSEVLSDIKPADLRSVQTLSIDFWGRDLVPQFLFELENVDTVSLSSYPLPFDELANTYRGKRQPRVLSFINGRGTVEITSSISHLTGVEDLRLFQNCIWTLPQELYSLVGLKKLDLSNTMLSFEQIAEVRQNLPDCEVVNLVTDSRFICEREIE